MFGMIEIVGQRQRTGKFRAAQIERNEQRAQQPSCSCVGNGEKARCFPAKGGEMIGRQTKLQLDVEGS